MSTIKTRKSNKLNPEELRVKIAELPSSYSKREMVVSISANVTTAKSALLFIYLGLYFEFWENDLLFKSIAQKAFLQNYKGKWKEVQDYLETQLQTPKEFEEKYLSEHNPEEFYGNFLPSAYKYSRLIKVQNLQLQKKQKVVKPQFHRGYKDHGSLRLPHEFHGDKPVGSEREDRRHLVQHPLLQEREKSTELRECVRETHHRKEEKNYVICI